jgi:transcriptional regulator with XRE-family HTH domain
MERKNLTQSQLTRELGVSRVRVTQMLNLLTLPVEQQNYILEHGKEKFIPLENALLSYSSGLFQILRR